MVYLSICIIFSFFHLHLTVVLAFASFARFIPRYFILFDALVNGIIFLILLSDLSLLVYRNTTDFYILILYSATLPNSLMSSSSFLVAFLGFSCIISCHMQTLTVLLFCPSVDFYISFSSLTAVAKTSKTMLNKSSESESPCLV